MYLQMYSYGEPWRRCGDAAHGDVYMLIQITAIARSSVPEVSALATTASAASKCACVGTAPMHRRTPLISALSTIGAEGGVRATLARNARAANRSASSSDIGSHKWGQRLSCTGASAPPRKIGRAHV